MVLVQSCIDNIGLLKKAASLFISLTLVFPLGFWRGRGDQQAVGVDSKAVREGVRPWKILSCCYCRREVEGWTKWPLGGEGASTPVTSSLCGFEILPEPPKQWEKLGGMWRSERKNGLDFGGEQVSGPQRGGACHLFLQWWKREKKQPPPPALWSLNIP